MKICTEEKPVLPLALEQTNFTDGSLDFIQVCNAPVVQTRAIH